jgi:Na+-translocating ferredoxin:NAD+ oxidoreductase RnfG subunit
MRNLLKSFAPPSKRFFIALSVLVAVVVTTVVLLLVFGNKQSFSSYQDFLYKVVAHKELTVTAQGIDNVRECLDKNGNVIGYRVESYTEEGFRDRVTVCSYISTDGKTLYGMNMVSHSESKGQGSQIGEDYFRMRFEMAKLPLWFNDGSLTAEQLTDKQGTEIETVSGATISCNAAVKAVQVGYTFVQEQLVK